MFWLHKWIWTFHHEQSCLVNCKTTQESDERKEIYCVAVFGSKLQLKKEAKRFGKAFYVFLVARNKYSCLQNCVGWTFVFLFCPEFDILPIFFQESFVFAFLFAFRRKFAPKIPAKFPRNRPFSPRICLFKSREISLFFPRIIRSKTRWIMWKFKQFITLIIVSFHCFFSYLNCLVRFLLLRLFKFILTISLNYKFPRASSSQVQFLINVWFQKISIPPPRKGFFIWSPHPSGFSKNGPQTIPPLRKFQFFPTPPGNISISCLKRKIS